MIYVFAAIRPPSLPPALVTDKSTLTKAMSGRCACLDLNTRNASYLGSSETSLPKQRHASHQAIPPKNNSPPTRCLLVKHTRCIHQHKDDTCTQCCSWKAECTVHTSNNSALLRHLPTDHPPPSVLEQYRPQSVLTTQTHHSAYAAHPFSNEGFHHGRDCESCCNNVVNRAGLNH
jgi:hypothetical protein